MADPHEQHGQAGHGSATTGAWLDTHMSGFMTPFGDRIEIVLEKLLVFFVTGVLHKVGVLLIVLIAPVILLELVIRTVRL